MIELVVGFSKPKNKIFPIFSWLIRLLEWTKYSHVYIRWRSDYLDRDLVYEASGTSVHFVEGSRFDAKVEVIHQYSIKITKEQKRLITQKAMDYAGAPYGIKQVFGIAYVKFMRIFGKDVSNPFSDKNATWVCSEVVSSVLKDIGMDMGINQDNVTPKDIQKYLEAIN